MTPYIFSKEKSEIVLDMPEPQSSVEYYSALDFAGEVRADEALRKYRDRPRYPVVKELADKWSDGEKVIEGKDFGIFYDGYIDSKDHSKAVPL